MIAKGINMKRFILALSSIMFLAFGTLALATDDTAEPPATETQWDMIHFEVKSWGGRVYAWQFTPQYGGVHMKNVQPDPSNPNQRATAYKTLDQNMQRYGALEAIIARLPTPAPDSSICEDFMSDDAYGTLRLTRGATTTEIAWNAGCKDEAYATFMTFLREADDLVGSWVKDVPVSRTEMEAN